MLNSELQKMTPKTLILILYLVCQYFENFTMSTLGVREIFDHAFLVYLMDFDAQGLDYKKFIE